MEVCSFDANTLKPFPRLYVVFSALKTTASEPTDCPVVVVGSH
jgi:hypothetical protein